MNIIDHILARRYPLDDAGRPLVPMRNGCVATIYATDAPELFVIVGMVPDLQIGRQALAPRWRADGTFHVAQHTYDLLPPPPRKVEVKAWAVMAGPVLFRLYESEISAQAASHGDPNWRVVPLTGSYEMPWEDEK